MARPILSIHFLSALTFFLIYSGLCTDNLAQKQSTGAKPDTGLFSRYDSLAVSLRCTDLAKARSYAMKAHKLALTGNQPHEIIRSLYLFAITTDPTDQDSIYNILIRAMDLSRKLGGVRDQSSLMYLLASIYSNTGQVRTAVLYLDSALIIAERYHYDASLGRIYNFLGNLTLESGDSAGALKYYRQALAIGTNTNDLNLMGVAQANIANMHDGLDIGKSELRQAIEWLRRYPGSEDELARTLVNAGLQETDPVKSGKLFIEAYRIGKQGRMAESQMGALNNLTYSLLDLGLTDSAERCVFIHAIPIARELNNHNWLATLYDTYADILTTKGDHVQASQYLKKAISEKTLDDAEKAMTQVRLYNAMLDTKSKERELVRRAAEIEEHKNIERIVVLAGVVAVLAAAIVVLIVMVRSQRKEIRVKKRELYLTKKMTDFEEQQTSIMGRELHDIVSSFMQLTTGVMSSRQGISTQDNPEPGIMELLNRLRSVSHRMYNQEITGSTLPEQVRELIEDSVNLTGLKITLEAPARLPACSDVLARNIYRIIQELIANAGKYARDANIDLSLGVLNDRIVILYRDTGPGIDQQKTGKEGIGIIGIRERVAFFGGKAVMESDPGNGLSWIISLPYEPQQKEKI